ncbi:flagellar hook-length control protein FliK [Helicobacter sp.]|uniref:flagellar hook-length control protein FliK n=1 Tax=Helicobacter sp. TaxID=218 RepID=UPI0025BF36E2|nr:flagellar hook-length control protein FliK [Helicobacter sp.]MCI5968799.1 flagellar hook-length control protein FliK [Helicobacter sp.]
MLPFLEVESIPKKSSTLIKGISKETQNLLDNPTENSQDFAQIFNALTQPITKKDSTLKTLNRRNKLTPNQQPSNFLKILDEKYNLTKDFKNQKTPPLKSAKDLLEFSSSQKQGKTLKDLSEVTKNLQLSLKKISIKSENVESKIESKNTIESKQQLQNIPKNSSLLNLILQDKNLVSKDSPKIRETKETKTIKQTKTESNILDSIPLKKKESQTNTKPEIKPESKTEIQLESKINSKSELDIPIKEKESKESKTESKTNSKLDFTKLESKINSKTKNEPNAIQRDFTPKNSKESQKEPAIKNDKQTEIRQNLPNTLNAVATQKEEITQQSLEQTKQESFLDNFLKTNQKPQSEPKELTQQPPKEKEIRKENEKLNQENYQNPIQTQRESRFNPQNTFIHFSDHLRDAITNYRPPVTKISLELNPQNLGSVELTIAKNGEKLSVQISSNQSALQLIMQNTQEFKNALGNLGFQNVEIDFKDNQGSSLSNGNFSDSSGNQQNGFQQGQQHNPHNFQQNTQQNSQNTENWNENSLHIDKKAKNPYEKLAIVELSFSYYA